MKSLTMLGRVVALALAAAALVLLLSVVAQAQTKPLITAPTVKSSELGKKITITATGSNLEIFYVGLTGEPNPSSNNEAYFSKQRIDRANIEFTPSTAEWTNKWLKIIAHDKVNDKWSDPVYVKITPMPPRISSPSNMSKTYRVGQGVIVNVDIVGSEVFEVFYAGLIGAPQPKSTLPVKPYLNELHIMSAKAHFTGGDNSKFRYTFTPPAAPWWSGKWVKIVAYSSASNLWSEPVYIQIQPPIVVDNVTGGTVVNQKIAVPNDGLVLVKDPKSKTCVIYLSEKVASQLYVAFTRPTALDYAVDWGTEIAGFIPVIGNFISVSSTMLETLKKIEVGKFAKAHDGLNACRDCFIRVDVKRTVNPNGGSDIFREYECVKQPQLSPGDGQYFPMSKLVGSDLSDYFYNGGKLKR